MSSRDDASAASTYESQSATGPPPTYASFSPVTLSANTPSPSARRSNILVHQKSPLLLATPPQVTRALAYSHPFLLPLNKLVGLLTWSTGDPWQSFLLLSAFWLVVLYGDVVVRRAGPVVIGMVIIAGMYGRRYSPLSSSGWTEPARPTKDASSGSSASASGSHAEGANSKKVKHQRAASEVTSTKHQKTLDEIVETLKEFTGRCNVLMEPLLEMTDFLSTQRTPTSATTKPALTAMFVRLLVVTPFWLALTMPPFHVITTRRVILVFGTIILSWHARPLRVTRTLLWRSSLVRRSAAAITGLRFDGPLKTGHKLAAEAAKGPSAAAVDKGNRKAGRRKSSGVKFTFIIYENQRRWVGLGWTASLFAYERPAWTDEHNNPVPARDDFELPDVEDGSRMRWQWVEGSQWRVDGASDERGPVDYDGEEGKNGWIYYDNKWQYGRRGQDGWAKWTRRRKWYRDAELVEVDESDSTLPGENGASQSPTQSLKKGYSTSGEKMVPVPAESHAVPSDQPDTHDDGASILSTSSKSSFWPSSFRRRGPGKSSTSSTSTEKGQSRNIAETMPDDDASGLDLETELELQKQGKDGGCWGIGDEAHMNLE
ncbi:peroxisomal membrane protein PEX31 [Metarhizium album ARSEF 1941]|uniref:Peroxisomal membrane protein PEX31 n=1 Tax=Metarhizium album (strain ARSEF 1941) TaxID=1081103 RepID=A0A0B2X5F9_METAS|nr:peroxisomal membrane protein PEX31 [Metarhizium album ARSEF 1941]KHO01619.1 peroxisomal membrane protein PEX31 [Metarhizium album ARSEF 1941]